MKIRGLLFVVCFLLSNAAMQPTAVGQPGPEIPLTGTQPPGDDQGQGSCGVEGEGEMAPSGPYESGDPFCRPPNQAETSRGPSAHGPKGFPEPHPSDHHLGAQTSGYTSTGLFAALNVVDPQIRSGTSDFYASRILIKTCNASDWIEVGWVEAGWHGTSQRVYTYDSQDRIWNFWTQYPISPGSRIYVEIFKNTQNGRWDALLFWNGNWYFLDSMVPGDPVSSMGCGNEIYAEVYTGSSGKHFPFNGSPRFGDGATSGVQLQNASTGLWQNWTTSIPTTESSNDGTGYYTVNWAGRYWDFSVQSFNRPPNLSFSLSPTSGGHRRTSFFANFTGTSDPDGDSVREKVDWGDGTVYDPSGTGSSHTYNAPGTYTVRATATDEFGAATTTTRTVTVTNDAPVARLSVSPLSGQHNITTFTADMSATTDPNSDALTYRIEWGDGSITSAKSGTHIYSSPGSYTVKGTATDSYGASSSVIQTVQVSNNGPSAVLTVSPAEGTVETTFTADMSGSSDPNGDPLTYRIDWGDGSISTTKTATHKYSSKGTYTVTGTVTDASGASSSASQIVSVRNSAPSARLTVTPGEGDLTTEFVADMSGSSDPDKEPLTFEIHWGDGSVSYEQTATHRYGSPGDYEVIGRAIDSSGAVGEASQVVRVCTVATDSCAAPPPGEALDEVQRTADEAAPGVFSTLSGAGFISDSAACPGEWFSVFTARCSHPDIVDAEVPLDADDPISAEYVAAAEAEATPAYCRQPSNANRYRVVYAYTGETSRYNRLRDDIRDKARKADYYVWASARQNGSSRHMRFVCNSDNRIRVWEVRLPRSADDNPNATYNALRAHSFYDRTKRYVVFADWADSLNTSTQFYCGWAERFGDDQPGAGNANNSSDVIALVFLRPDNPCFDKAAHSALHEVGHTLGAVQRSAPNHCCGGHTSQKHDAMRNAGTGTLVAACSEGRFANRYDCGDDDYFNADPTLPARRTYLADQQEYETGVCQRVRDGDVMRATQCRWNTAWSRWLIGGGL